MNLGNKMFKALMAGVVLGGVIGLNRPSFAADEPSKLPILEDRPDGGRTLGETFISESAGLSFRPPVGGALVRGGAGDNIAQYNNEDKNWQMNVVRTQLREQASLRDYEDASGRQRAGMLQMTLDQFRRQQPGAKVLRQDYMKVGGHDAGVLVLRYSVATSRKLMQIAIFQANDQVFYTFTLTSPGLHNTDDPSLEPQEQQAVDVFRQVVDSVEILDRAAIRLDQNNRLYRTRTFFVNLTPQKIRQAMVAQQWLRLMRNGKDIGYTFMVQEADPDQTDGVRIGLRSRTIPQEKVQVDAEAWLATTLDRRHESWTNSVVVKRDGKEDFTTEFGVSNVETERVLDRDLLPGTKDDPQQPPVRTRELHTLAVSYVAKMDTPPSVKRDLPVFYIPQAISQMLPSLLPLNEPKGYLFAVWVSDRHEVMARYVDVLPLAEVFFDGKKQMVVTIRDRVGLEGTPTYHYMSPGGQYLGSENKQTGIMIVPTDEPTLRKIWVDADLTRPRHAPAAE